MSTNKKSITLLLAFDCGNTSCKAAVADAQGTIIDSTAIPNGTESTLRGWLEGGGRGGEREREREREKEREGAEKAPIAAAIVANSGGNPQKVIEILQKLKIPKIITLDHNTKIPLKNLYKTPETIGLDRLAVAVAAHAKFPENEKIIIDLGTAITIDYVNSNGEFIGGNISAGLELRLKALNQYTQKLPLIDHKTIAQNNNTEQFGTSTQQALIQGTVQGICNEIEGYITQNSNKKVFLTGGDAKYFEKLIKFPIFVDCQANLKGLLRILKEICLEN